MNFEYYYAPVTDQISLTVTVEKAGKSVQAISVISADKFSANSLHTAFKDISTSLSLTAEQIDKFKKFIESNIGHVTPLSSTSTPIGRSKEIDKFPGIKERVKCPCGVHSNLYEAPLEMVIIHLNDTARWTLNQIADWLDTLDIDLKFKTPSQDGNPCAEIGVT